MAVVVAVAGVMTVGKTTIKKKQQRVQQKRQTWQRREQS
jgi:hypothetical protein